VITPGSHRLLRPRVDLHAEFLGTRIARPERVTT
jgi:hypothetical protein